MSKSKKHRRYKKNKKKIKELPKKMIPEVEKDISTVLELIDDISKIDFWSDDSDKDGVWGIDQDGGDNDFTHDEISQILIF